MSTPDLALFAPHIQSEGANRGLICRLVIFAAQFVWGSDRRPKGAARGAFHYWAAIAAGCTIVLKVSNVLKACEDLIMQMVPNYLDASAIGCGSAGSKEMGYILQHRFDHIF